MASNNEKGFTLIEIIISIVLMAIIATVVGMGFLRVVEGYVFARTNADIVGKGQMAITRMVKELSYCTITAGTVTSVTFARRSDNTAHTLAWTNGATVLLLDGETLTDRVNGLAFGYIYKLDGSSSPPHTTPSSSTVNPTVQVQITLQLTAADNVVQPVTVTNRVYIGGL